MPVAFRDVQYGTGAVGHRRQRLAKRPVGLRRRLRQWVRISTGRRPAHERCWESSNRSAVFRVCGSPQPRYCGR